jgi:hypothetical protein
MPTAVRTLSILCLLCRKRWEEKISVSLAADGSIEVRLYRHTILKRKIRCPKCGAENALEISLLSS